MTAACHTPRHPGSSRLNYAAVAVTPGRVLAAEAGRSRPAVLADFRNIRQLKGGGASHNPTRVPPLGLGTTALDRWVCDGATDGSNNPQTPHWDRQAQIVVAFVLAVIAISQRRWPAVLLLGAGARIALDPGVHGYYTAGCL
jgi:hypothetical protein